MARAYLISETKLKALSKLGQSLDMDIINPLVLEMQEMYIQPILGSTLYNELLTQVDAGTLTAANTTLLNDHIQPCLIKWIEYEAPIELTYKFSSKGLVKRTGEDTEAVDSSEIKDLMDRLKNKAEWYSERVTKFLCENEADYPSYRTPGTGEDVIQPNKSNYQTGWFLD